MAVFSLHPNGTDSAPPDPGPITHLFRSAVDDGQICPLLQAELSAEVPRVLHRGYVIQAFLVMEPSLLEVGICRD